MVHLILQGNNSNKVPSHKRKRIGKEENDSSWFIRIMITDCVRKDILENVILWQVDFQENITPIAGQQFLEK